MRYPGENGAGQPSGRRRGASEPDAQPRRRHGADSGQSRDSALFSPGYRDSQQAGATGEAEPGRYGRAGGTAGKGPLRGFPPAPGQPPPLYPPGQFSAWNRASAPGRGGDRPGTGPSGPEAGYQDAGYSALAVSDPAADVTSTQTWGAVSDGRETGTWRYPAAPDGSEGGPGTGRGTGPQSGRGRAAAGQGAAPATAGPAGLRQPPPGQPGSAGQGLDDGGAWGSGLHDTEGWSTGGGDLARQAGLSQDPGAAGSAGQDTGAWHPAAGPAAGRARHGKPARSAGQAGTAGTAGAAGTAGQPGQRPADGAAGPRGGGASPEGSSPAAGAGLAGTAAPAGVQHASGPADGRAPGTRPATRQDGLPADGRGSSGRAGRGPEGRGPAGRAEGRRGRAARKQAARDSAGPAVPAASRAASGADRTAAPASEPAAKAAASGSRSGRAGRARKRSGRGPVLISIAIVVVLGALTYYLVSRQHASTAQQAAQSPAAAAPAASPPPVSPSATAKPPPAGRWRYITARASDPLPLTLSELFPVRFTAGAAYTRSAGVTGRKCAVGVVGQRLQHAVASAGCSQVLRATYLSAGKKQMGTIGVLNLRTASAAAKAGKATGPAQFIRPLNARRGPASKLSKAAGLEEAEVKGHYLILVFADGTSGHAPKGKAERQALVTFMNQLIRHTVNVSLTSRMVVGKP